MTVSLQCTEHQDSFYAFGLQIQVPEIPDTNLPNPFIVQAPSIEVADELRVLNEEAISVQIYLQQTLKYKPKRPLILILLIWVKLVVIDLN